jgi:hypothetical protein
MLIVSNKPFILCMIIDAMGLHIALHASHIRAWEILFRFVFYLQVMVIYEIIVHFVTT